MELHHIKTFVAVAETGSITKAAARVHTTPPAVSMQIKQLEEELDVRLFKRSAKGAELTPKGKELYTKAVETLKSAQDFLNTANSNAVSGEVRIGINSSILVLKIPELIQTLNPSLTLNLVESNTQTVIKQVLSNDVEIGFCYGDIPDTVEQLKLARIPIALVAPLTWNTEYLHNKSWVYVDEDCPFDKFAARHFSKDQIQYLVKCTTEKSRYELVAEGIGISLLELFQAKLGVQEGNIKIIKELEEELQLSLIYKAADIKIPKIRCTIEAIAELWGVTLDG